MLFGPNGLGHGVEGIEFVIQCCDRLGEFGQVEDSFLEHSHHGRYGDGGDEDKTGKKTENHDQMERLLSQIDGLALEEQIVMGNPTQVFSCRDQAHACSRDGSKTVSGATGQKNSRKGDMEDEKKDERARQAACEMDEEKHGAIVKAHLPVSETFDIFLLNGVHS